MRYDPSETVFQLSGYPGVAYALSSSDNFSSLALSAAHGAHH